MQNPESVSFLMAFAAGFLTFLSPCVLPLIPSYISYLTGVSFSGIAAASQEKREKNVRILTLAHSAAFILGFSLVFVILGASVTILGRLLYDYLPLLKMIGGAFIIFFALVITGIIRIPFLEKEKKFSYRKGGVSIMGSVLVGAVFAGAWTPCIGPILGTILIYASSTASLKRGIFLLIFYSAGLAVPFLLSGLAINSFLAHVKKIQNYMKWIRIAAGAVLAAFGAFLITGIF